MTNSPDTSAASRYVPGDYEVVHEHEDYAVYVKPSGKLGIAYSHGCVELTPADWVARFYAAASLREQLDYVWNTIWHRKAAA